ncbi:MAG TPA: hemerythrin domain-containing protein [Candidatus Dormibacteraeota bacterium]|nr:hemerythrin domain-containing protein [Candidatus Dormibacteraeota bacterium]
MAAEAIRLMHPILEGLLHQHRDAEVMLKDLRAITGRVRGGAVRQPDVMAELSRLRHEIQGEVLSHFREEELALFPVLGRHVDASSGPIAILMEEHAQFRQLELEFDEALAAIESGYQDGWEDKLCDAADAIERLLPPHIEKEDEVLFPMAETMLDESEWNEVERLWREAMAATSEHG